MKNAIILSLAVPAMLAVGFFTLAIWLAHRVDLAPAESLHTGVYVIATVATVMLALASVGAFVYQAGLVGMKLWSFDQ